MKKERIWKAPDDVALIIVDVQNDFCPGGKLAVAQGDEVVPVINELKKHFNTVVLTQDWHPEGHSSFASAHPGKKPFDTVPMPYGAQVLWPDHCVQGTEGAEFHPALDVSQDDFLLRKGANPRVDSYSGFFENDGVSQPRFAYGLTLKDVLEARGIKTVVLTGLAFDYCVGWHALDAVREKFNAVVVRDATRFIASETAQEMEQKLKSARVTLAEAATLQYVLRP